MLGRSVFSGLVALLVGVATLPLTSVTYAQVDTDLKFSGDFRLRYENTYNQETAAPFRDARNREVVRLRGGLSKAINERLLLGARVTTGSSEDPNTADVTLGDFVNDLEISLDRVYLQFSYEGATLTGGKFANPFLRTDLIWDGDVNPQGVAASYGFSVSDRFKPKVAGMFSIVDEHSQTDIPDSHMWGAQVQVAARPADDWNVTVASSYCDYRIESLSNADAGDTRSNNLTADGLAYVSDFNLLDAIAILEHRGFGGRYPIKFIGNYVKNLGAEVDDDQGYMLDLFIGKASRKNDARFRYGYSQADTDAVLAAFSNDNTTIATNYEQHTVTVDYVVLENTTLNLTWYLHRLKNPAPDESDAFISRLRLNAIVTF